MYPSFGNLTTHIVKGNNQTNGTGCSPYLDFVVGNGFCDDITNNIECDYDGGDCCGPNANYSPYFCNECQCCDAGGCNATNTTTTGM